MMGTAYTKYGDEVLSAPRMMESEAPDFMPQGQVRVLLNELSNRLDSLEKEIELTNDTLSPVLTSRDLRSSATAENEPMPASEASPLAAELAQLLAHARNLGWKLSVIRQRIDL